MKTIKRWKWNTSTNLIHHLRCNKDAFSHYNTFINFSTNCISNLTFDRRIMMFIKNDLSNLNWKEEPLFHFCNGALLMTISNINGIFYRLFSLLDWKWCFKANDWELMTITKCPSRMFFIYRRAPYHRWSQSLLNEKNI